MNEYYVTFGDMYRYEPHPSGWPHPDGYLTIVAPDYDTARAKAFEVLGSQFAFMYKKLPNGDYFPLGELMRITVEARQ